MAEVHTDDKRQADAEKRVQAEQARQAEAAQRGDEARKAANEAARKRLEEDQQEKETAIAAARKYLEAKRKEDKRRAALSPEDREAEDAKLATMTLDEREKDAESKGLVKPDGPEINPLVAGPPSFAPLTEPSHSAEFVMSEAAGHGSRDNVTIAIGDSVKLGQTLKVVTPATLTAPAVATGNVTTDTAADAIALYSVPVSTVAQQVAVISRNAEVNGNLLYFPGTILTADKNNIAKALAVHNIMVRM